MATTWINVPIYNYPVLFATKEKDIPKALSERYEGLQLTAANEMIKASAPIDESYGWVLKVSNSDGSTVCGVMFVADKRDNDTVAHEAVHLAWDIIDFVQIDVEHTNHEALAYLVGFIVDEFKKSWKKYE